MVELTRRAYVVEGGGIALGKGEKLLGEGFKRLRRLAALTRGEEPQLDISAVFVRVISHDYKNALRTDLVFRAANARIAAAGLSAAAPTAALADPHKRRRTSATKAAAAADVEAAAPTAAECARTYGKVNVKKPLTRPTAEPSNTGAEP
eukprot:3454824-Pleurochrysis_carterae.AAC.3